MTGGGLITVTGFLAYQHGLFADLAATGNGIRIRYPQGVSSLADVRQRTDPLRIADANSVPSGCKIGKEAVLVGQKSRYGDQAPSRHGCSDLTSSRSRLNSSVP